MGVMAARRKRKPAWEELPREPEPFADLPPRAERTDTGHHRAEIIGGALIVSPVPVFWHQRVCRWLMLSLLEACDANDWFGDSAGEIELPSTGDLICPDFMVRRAASLGPDRESTSPVCRARF